MPTDTLNTQPTDYDKLTTREIEALVKRKQEKVYRRKLIRQLRNRDRLL